MARRDSADVIFLRNQQEINEEYNASTAKRTPTGAQVVLTPRQQQRILEALSGCSDEVAESIRTLLEDAPEDAQGTSVLSAYDGTLSEVPGQRPDPTSASFWYGTTTVSAAHVLTCSAVPHTPSGWRGAWRRWLLRAAHRLTV